MRSARQKWDLAPSTLSAAHNDDAVENRGEAEYRQSLRHSVDNTTSSTAVEARDRNVGDLASAPDPVVIAKTTPNTASQQSTVKDEYKNSAPVAAVDVQESSEPAATQSQSAVDSLPTRQQEEKEQQHQREQQQQRQQQERRQIRRINMLLLLEEQDKKAKKMAASASRVMAPLEERALSPW